jgi:hypothetical protein
MVTEFFADHWQAISFIMALLFNAGIMYKTFKDKPSIKTVEDMIAKSILGHCPIEDRISKIEKWKDELVRDNVIVARSLVIETERTHLTAQRIELNLRRICDKLDVTYLDNNK